MDTPPVPSPTHVRVNADQIQITAPDGVDLADLAERIVERLPQEYTPGGTIISGPISVQPSAFTQIKDQIRSSALSTEEVNSLREELRSRSWEIANDLEPGALSKETLVASGGWCVPTELAYDFGDIRTYRDKPDFAVRDTDALDEPRIKDELTALLNRFSAESPSGTPDHILADLLIGVLREFNEAVSRRSEWRGESVELPSLQRQSESNIDPEPEEKPEREDIDEGPMLVAGRVKTLRQPGHKRAAKLLRKAAAAVADGNVDEAEQYRKLAEVRLQWGVK